MKKVILFGLLCMLFSNACKKTDIMENKWTPLQTVEESGTLGDRINLWRNNRLWLIEESGFLIEGFEHRPGTHPWQGEHFGKWLHACTLSYIETKDEKLKNKMEELVDRLLKTQLPDGYLGTYAEAERFTNIPEVVDPRDVAGDIEDPNSLWNRTKGGWDTWTFRYNLYGLLFYEHYFPNKKIVDACKKMADLLIEVYGSDSQYDITKYGTNRGISATTLLESIVMLYERTKEPRYLDFAEHIVKRSEGNPHLQLMGTMLGGGSVVHPGEGKGYQLMANLLGYLRLYRCTGNEDYLNTVLYAWNDIKAHHLLVTGGPWSRKTGYNENNECFAYMDAFNPGKLFVEGCCDATWIQLNIHLFEFTGKAKYFNEAERTLINSVYGHQSLDGKSWTCYTKPNELAPKYESRFHCCGSSEPRGLEMYSHNLVGNMDGHLVVNSFGSSAVALSDEFGDGKLRIDGNFPVGNRAVITLESESAATYTLEFRVPADAELSQVSVNGKKTEAVCNARGFYEMNREWHGGDTIQIEVKYLLRSHVEKGEDGRQWMAFTYGPMALAQKIYQYPENNPLLGIAPDTAPADVLEQLPGDDIQFRIKGTDIVLIPYFLTSSTETGGPYTYFEI